jgi:hypothetical protein
MFNKFFKIGNPNNLAPFFGRSDFLIVESLRNLTEFYSFHKKFELIETNLDEVRFFEDLNGRRRLDAEVLSLVAANVPAGKMLDIGTYLGHSAARMAVNSPGSLVYTVNIHPDELLEGGEFVTGAPKAEEIGSYYRENGLSNIQQIFANTKNWQIPVEICDLSLVYVDGCHDTECVYNDTKLVLDRVMKGGFILWHDCSPVYRSNYAWIDSAMRGIEKLQSEGLITPYILNVKHSWVGLWRKV